MSFIRVSPRNKCPVCDKPDWCSVCEDGGVICMRVESRHPTKNGGWYHPPEQRIKHEYRKPEQPKPVYVPDFNAMLSHWRSGTADRLERLSESLGLGLHGLCELGACYADVHQAYAFPMF